MNRDAAWWRQHIGENVCGYYDGKLGVLQEVVDFGDSFFLVIENRRMWADYCSLDTDEDRWLHPEHF